MEEKLSFTEVEIEIILFSNDIILTSGPYSTKAFEGFGEDLENE